MNQLIDWDTDTDKVGISHTNEVGISRGVNEDRFVNNDLYRTFLIFSLNYCVWNANFVILHFSVD